MDKKNEVGRSPFQTSGKINWVRFIPLAALAWTASAGLAVLLFFLFLWGFYFIFIVPLIVSLAVGGMVLLAVQKGQCRNRLVAGLLGVLAGLTLYLGYYYVGMVYSLGMESAVHVEFLPTYIAFRMQTDVIKDEHSPRDEDRPSGRSKVMNWVVFVGELACVLAFSSMGGIRRTRKPYCEKCQSWMNRETTRFKPEIGPAFVEALRLGAVQSLAALFTSPSKAAAPHTAVALDYCPSLKSGRSTDCTVYMSVKQVTENAKGATFDAFESAKGQMLIRQTRINPEELAALLPRFSVLETVTGTTAAEALKEMQVEVPAEKPLVYADIRPVDPQFAGKVLTTKTKLIGTALVLFLFLMFAASFALLIFGGVTAYPTAGGASSVAKLSGLFMLGLGAVFLIISFLVTLTRPDYFATRYLLGVVRREFARRQNFLVNPNDPLAHFVQIIPRENWGKLKLEDASDVGFLRLDLEQGEVLFEGDREYYRIPAAAISSCEVERFVSGEGSHGATTHYRLVLEMNRPTGSWEAPIGPRGGSGKFRSKKRLKWAQDLEQQIKAMMLKS